MTKNYKDIAKQLKKQQQAYEFNNLFEDLTQEDSILMVIETIKKELQDGHKVNLKGLGVLEIITKPEKQSYNPHTKGIITIPERKALDFRPSVGYVKELNNVDD